ncbi:MAG: hypothetical protein WCL38_09080 [Actinomycetota bacterium]
MKRTLFPILTIALGGLALSACSSSTSSTPSASKPVNGTAASKVAASSDCHAYAEANPLAKVVSTTDYVMVAGVGPNEAMYTHDQVMASKPTSGELMVSGMMDGSHSMSMGTGTTMQHVEVHICSRATGKAIGGAMPTMTFSEVGSNSMPTDMSVTEMTSLDGNAADIHYGNNITMMMGSKYSFRVTLNGQSGIVTMSTRLAK